jgi:hypothetical protein
MNQLTRQDTRGQLAIEDVGGEDVVSDVDDAEGEQEAVGEQGPERQE